MALTIQKAATTLKKLKALRMDDMKRCCINRQIILKQLSNLEAEEDTIQDELDMINAAVEALDKNSLTC
jgi:exonuclease I